MKRFKNVKEEIATIPQEVGSVLCEGLTFKDGNLSGVGKITINCYFVGNISTNDLVIVDEAGNILGNIESQALIIKGNVKGNVEAVEAAQIRTGGVLNGDIKCSTLEISAGAAFSGNCNMTASKKESNMLLNMKSAEEIAERPPLPMYTPPEKKRV
ncbi:MAG: polymer-forming cytoskeletal protein [Clostridiales bacterium]|jgi:cytoskeletal protein CcmA (bactofilin family)|nr:polymer-forming cytoskeletal protein [Clostridiales bacterium]